MELFRRFTRSNSGGVTVPEMKAIIEVGSGAIRYEPLTLEEIAQREADAAKAEADRAEREAAEQAKADAKLNAMAKLQALGLTGEEIAAIL